MTDEMESVLDEMIKLIKDNLQILLLNDRCLTYFKDYCNSDAHYFLPVPYYELVRLVDESLADFINMDFWYDFRDLD